MPTLYRSGDRRGPKFTITLDMALQNIRTVAERLQVTRLSIRQYCAHGSYHSRILTRRWKWSYLCELAGLTIGRPGLQRTPRRPCMNCQYRASMTIGRHCRTCRRRIERWA